MTIIDIIQTQKGLKHGNPATDEAISNAEEALALHFSEEYKEYVKKYGVATFDEHDLSGIMPGYRLDVVTMTNDVREMYESLPTNLYMIEDAYIDGIIILQSEDGSIYQVVPYDQPTKIANTLLEYIQSLS